MSNTIRKERKKTIVIVAALVAVMAIGGISAYFTSADDAVNTWTYGKVKIDLQEPNYDKEIPSDRVNTTPNQEVAKDPKIQNTGKNDAYVFIKVTVPKKDVIVANQDGTRQDSKLQELVDYQWNTNWVVVEEDTTAADHNTYVMAYAKDGACLPLAPQATTSVLFKNAVAEHIENAGAEGIITIKNIIEGQGLENMTLTINVEAYAIQTTDLSKDNVNSPAAVWTILSNQTNNTTVGDLTDYFNS